MCLHQPCQYLLFWCLVHFHHGDFLVGNSGLNQGLRNMAKNMEKSKAINVNKKCLALLKDTGCQCYLCCIWHSLFHFSRTAIYFFYQWTTKIRRIWCPIFVLSNSPIFQLAYMYSTFVLKSSRDFRLRSTREAENAIHSAKIFSASNL